MSRFTTLLSALTLSCLALATLPQAHGFIFVGNPPSGILFGEAEADVSLSGTIHLDEMGLRDCSTGTWSYKSLADEDMPDTGILTSWPVGCYDKISFSFSNNLDLSGVTVDGGTFDLEANVPTLTLDMVQDITVQSGGTGPTLLLELTAPSYAWSGLGTIKNGSHKTFGTTSNLAVGLVNHIGDNVALYEDADDDGAISATERSNNLLAD